jgi:hypothetical protein
MAYTLRKIKNKRITLPRYSRRNYKRYSRRNYKRYSYKRPTCYKRTYRRNCDNLRDEYKSAIEKINYNMYRNDKQMVYHKWVDNELRKRL